jgi:DNA-binding transcriptional regulator YiaG
MKVQMPLRKPNSHALRFGPYRPPRTRRGDKLFCEIRGTVTVGGYTDAPIPWPRVKKGGRPCLILCGDLVRAVKQEALIAIAYHWGINETTVWKWRTALGVKRWNEGSTELMRDWVSVRDDDRLERARTNSKTPAALAKASQSLKGRVQSPATIEAVRRAAQRPRSEAWKRKIAQTWRKRGHRPHNPNHRPWTAEEDALLGTDRDPAIARQLGRTLKAVQMRRLDKRVPACVAKLAGRRIQSLREQRGWSRRELAAHAGLSYDTILRVEIGQLAGLGRDRAMRLAAALGILLSEIEVQFTVPPATDADHSNGRGK